MQDVTNKGKELIERWKDATRGEESAKEKLLKAQRELQTAEEHLAHWLLPEDAKDGEKFCVWYGDSLITASESDTNGYEVTVRKRGTSLMV
jgi:hypothetical protein